MLTGYHDITNENHENWRPTELCKIHISQQFLDENCSELILHPL